MTTFNLRTIRLQSGEQFRDVKEVELEPLELGGQRYVPIPEKPEAALTPCNPRNCARRRTICDSVFLADRNHRPTPPLSHRSTRGASHV